MIMESNNSAIVELIKNRRSVYPKNFAQGKTIEKEVIESILDLATWAPTHKLTQPWAFIVYQGNGKIRFFKKQAEIYQQITPAEKINNQKLKKYQEKAEQVSHVIAVIAKHDPENRIPEIEEVVATSCALQNIYLSLDSFGVSGYLSTGGICYSEQMAEFLQLEKGDKILGFFQLGIPAENMNMPQRKRIPASDKTKWVDK
jgi:nitroreductase